MWRPISSWSTCFRKKNKLCTSCYVSSQQSLDWWYPSDPVFIYRDCKKHFCESLWIIAGGKCRKCKYSVCLCASNFMVSVWGRITYVWDDQVSTNIWPHSLFSIVFSEHSDNPWWILLYFSYYVINVIIIIIIMSHQTFHNHLSHINKHEINPIRLTVITHCNWKEKKRLIISIIISKQICGSVPEGQMIPNNSMHWMNALNE